ncbi:MAG: elongation factor Ts [Clostridia bacterium]|nr:elongation factor Ts [Clostridia bacterium]
MAITAKDVAELRKQTGSGMMDCKNALTEANGNFAEAIKILREKGMATAAKKQSRIAAEGVVAVYTENGVTAMAEVNTETDFAAKGDAFQAFVKDLLKTIVASKPATVEELMTKTMPAGNSVDEALQEISGAILHEKVSIRRFVVVEGAVSTYIHGAGETGVVISFEVAPAAVAETEAFAAFAKNVALQAAAIPSLYVDRASVPQSALDEEMDILKKQMEQDPKFAGKPANVIEGIVKGKMGKYFETNCLLEQGYVKDDSLTVGKYVAAAAKELGAEIKVVSFVRYDKGEGIEKKEDDLAAEVQKMING